MYTWFLNTGGLYDRVDCIYKSGHGGDLTVKRACQLPEATDDP